MISISSRVREVWHTWLKHIVDPLLDSVDSSLSREVPETLLNLLDPVGWVVVRMGKISLFLPLELVGQKLPKLRLNVVLDPDFS